MFENQDHLWFVIVMGLILATAVFLGCFFLFKSRASMNHKSNPFYKLARHLLEQKREKPVPEEKQPMVSATEWQQGPLSSFTSTGQLQLSTKRKPNYKNIEPDHILCVSPLGESKQSLVAWFIDPDSRLLCATFVDESTAIPPGIPYSRSESAVVAPTTAPTTAPTKLLVLINPNSGKGKSRSVHLFSQSVEPVFLAAKISYEIYQTKGPSDGESYIHQYDSFSSVEGIISMGGDGILHEIINGVMSRPDGPELIQTKPLGVIPAGTANGIAYCAGYETALDAAVGILKSLLLPNQESRLSGSKRLDIFQVSRPNTRSPRYGVLSFTHCVLSYVDLGSEHLRFLGNLRFDLTALAYIITPKPYHYHLALTLSENQTTIMIHDDLVFFSIFNVPYLQKSTCCVPGARMHDQNLHVIVMPMYPDSFSPIVVNHDIQPDMNMNTSKSISEPTDRSETDGSTETKAKLNNTRKISKPRSCVSRLRMLQILSSMNETGDYIHQYPDNVVHYPCSKIDILPCPTNCQHTGRVYRMNSHVRGHETLWEVDVNVNVNVNVNVDVDVDVDVDVEAGNRNQNNKGSTEKHHYFCALDGEVYNYVHNSEPVSVTIASLDGERNRGRKESESKNEIHKSLSPLQLVLY